MAAMPELTDGFDFGDDGRQARRGTDADRGVVEP
jgi:hypothetical protein